MTRFLRDSFSSPSIRLHRLRFEWQGNSRLAVFEGLIKGEASHDLLEAKTGYNSEYMRLRGYVPGYWNTMTTWLRRHTGLER